MVGPPSDVERSRTMVRVKIAFVILIGASTGLLTTQGDATPVVVIVAVVAGLLVGVVLVWYLFPGASDRSSTLVHRDRFKR
ncbi:MAG: hypothetical protein ACOCQ3_03730 [Natronomonas sp.]